MQHYELFAEASTLRVGGAHPSPIPNPSLHHQSQNTCIMAWHGTAWHASVAIPTAKIPIISRII